eukprot:CAMPEP_0180796514 /NCGR_PEP_ID=MMETSP1038_2-20121128/56833_1 /TAXON_ID=632150 /ORGANISM="Azadinium spinosum, Strain 3D9" /LENGTH=170 /DNA_ID=CAMNT_0022835625 /DNA_START=42 /DNA_END=550 /DNA_ORIENTATION=+
MSRWPDYHQLLQPLVARSVDSVIVPGSKRRLGGGCAGDIFECRLQSSNEQCVMKAPKMDIQMWPKNGISGSTNQRWLCKPCEGDEPFFHIFSEAFPSKVLEIYKAADDAPPRLNLGELRQGARHQKWRQEADGVACASADNGAQVVIEQRKDPPDKHQLWKLKPARGGVT